MNTRCVDGTGLGELVEVSLTFPATDQELQLVIDIADLVALLPLKDSAASRFVFTADPLSVLTETVVDRDSAEAIAKHLEAWAAKIRAPFIKPRKRPRA
jgi:hypothetical protein